MDDNGTTTMTLTREVLESAMMDWTKQNEGSIAYEYVGVLLNEGDVITALDRVATSMQIKQGVLNDNNSCLIWSAWMNLQQFGTPGFPLSKTEIQ